jgi:glycyl-tRNA synthetase beta chain
VAVALADKIDTLTGFWAIDEKPTGSKDPFALRRAALGVIRLVLSIKSKCALAPLIAIQIAKARGAQSGKRRAENQRAIADFIDLINNDPEVDPYPWAKTIAVLKSELDESDADIVGDVMSKTSDLLAFLHDRLKVHLRDQGIRHDVIDASLAMPGSDDLTLLVKRAEALAAFLKTEDGTNLLQGFKRANNILTQAEEKDGVEYSYGADPKFAESPEETALFTALDAAEAAIAPAMEAEDFAAAMTAMAALRAPVDAFFEAVQVNSDNSILRRNRLNLLSRIRRICLSVADLTKVEG